MSCFWWIGLNTSLADLLWMKSYIWYFYHPLIVSIEVLNSRSNHFVFSRTRARFQGFFVEKLFFSVFPLNSIEDKHSKLISLINSPYEVKYRWNEYHKYSYINYILNLLVVNSFIWWFLFLFRLEFNFKEQSFRVYRSQRYILIILPKKSVLLGLHCS